MKFIKVLDVKSPSRGTPGSAGIDFYIPEYTEKFVKEFEVKNPHIFIGETGIKIWPHERVNIPSGIKCNIPYGYALIAFNKSGVSLKYGLDVGATVIDSDYQGEIHLSLTNTSNQEIWLDFGQKIIQFLLIPIREEDMEEAKTEKEVFDQISIRGAGGFGSTGTK